MTTVTDLQQRISTHFPQLSSKQKRIARFISDNEYFVAFATVNVMGQKTGTSAATVVRFCQAIGYEGYVELQAAIREQLPRYLTYVEKVEKRLASAAPENEVLARVFATDASNIERTTDLVDPETFEAAVAAICRASGILVVGGGLSAPPALFFAHSLRMMGFSVRVVTTDGMPLALELSALRPTDLLIGISFRRYLRGTVKAMYKAKEIGATRIAITDSELSPLARLADYPFLVATEGTAHNLSPVAPISLINAFVAALSLEVQDQALHALQQVDASYRESSLLLQE